MTDSYGDCHRTESSLRGWREWPVLEYAPVVWTAEHPKAVDGDVDVGFRHEDEVGLRVPPQQKHANGVQPKHERCAPLLSKVRQLQ